MFGWLSQLSCITSLIPVPNSSQPKNPSMTPRVTQRDIARKAGVSHVSVSLALRGDPAIPEQTRTRIEKIAAELGYAPDPMLTALSSYRKQNRPAAYHANIAWLYTSPHATRTGWGDFGLYYKGAQERAKQLGYMLDEISLVGKTEFRWLRRLLDARNITGLIVSPAAINGTELNFDFSRYSAVRLGYSYASLQLNTVANAQFRTSLIAMQKAAALGYQRIGTILTEVVDERTSWHFLGGYLAGQHLLPRKHWLAPFYPPPGVDLADSVYDWIVKEKPDCFIAAGYWDLYHALVKKGLDLPGTIGYLDTQLLEDDDHFSGLHQNSRQIGVAAVDLLVSMLHRHDTGLPAVPLHLLIEGSWRDGKTMPNRNPVPTT